MKRIWILMALLVVFGLSSCKIKNSYEREVEIVKQPVKIETKQEIAVHKSEYGYHIHYETKSGEISKAYVNVSEYTVDADGNYVFVVVGSKYTYKMIVHTSEIRIIERANVTYCPICGYVIE